MPSNNGYSSSSIGQIDNSWLILDSHMYCSKIFTCLILWPAIPTKIFWHGNFLHGKFQHEFFLKFQYLIISLKSVELALLLLLSHLFLLSSFSSSFILQGVLIVPTRSVHQSTFSSSLHCRVSRDLPALWLRGWRVSEHWLMVTAELLRHETSADTI